MLKGAGQFVPSFSISQDSFNVDFFIFFFSNEREKGGFGVFGWVRPELLNTTNPLKPQIFPKQKLFRENQKEAVPKSSPVHIDANAELQEV